MTRSIRGALGVLLILSGVSCGGESPTQPAGPMSLQVAVTPSSLVPGKTVQLVVTATPPAGESVSSLQFSISGAFSYTDSIGYTTQGVVTMARSITLPMLTGPLTITATAHGSGGSVGTQQASFAVADLVAPTLTASATPSSTPGIIQAGDTIRVAMQSSDDVSVTYLLLRSTGAIVATDSGAASTMPVYVMERRVSFVVPASTPLNATFTLTAETKDLGGNVVRKDLGTYAVRDTAPPAISARVWGARANGAFAPGDTAIITLSATDNRALRSYGFQLSGGITDSAAASGKTAERTVRFTVPGVGTYALSSFATDSAGNRTQVSALPIKVETHTRKPVMYVPLAGVFDVAWDAKRGIIWASQPDSGVLASIYVAGNSYYSGYKVSPGRPWGIDVTNGGDTLVIALRGTRSLGFMSLISGSMDSTTRVVMDSTQGQTPVNLRITADNRAIFSVTWNGAGYGGSVSAYDLDSHQLKGSVSTTEAVPLVASANRMRVFALSDTSFFTQQAFLYDAASGSFTVPKPVVSGSNVDIAADYHGAHVLVGKTFMSSQFELVRNMAATGALTRPVALSYDGSYAYLGTADGFVKMRTMDGVEIERVALGHAPTHFRMLPDGLTLVATSATTVDIIDLW